MSIHAGSCASLNGQGVLLLGPSGSGKSDLLLRLMDRGWRFVSDDQTDISVRENALIAKPVKSIEGLIEIRGLGICRVKNGLAETPLSLAVELVNSSAVVERMPESAILSLEGKPLPVIQLHAFEHSAPLKLEWALEMLRHTGRMQAGALERT